MYLLQQHKTYLGEDEIQHAVEAAAVLFKKVVLQRREEKRTKDEGEYRNNQPTNQPKKRRGVLFTLIPGVCVCVLLASPSLVTVVCG